MDLRTITKITKKKSARYILEVWLTVNQNILEFDQEIMVSLPQIECKE